MKAKKLADYPDLLDECASIEFGTSRIERAANYIRKYPEIAQSLIAIRQQKSVSIDAGTAKVFVALGIFEKDEKGYFLSEFSEILIDNIIEALKEKNKEGK